MRRAARFGSLCAAMCCVVAAGCSDGASTLSRPGSGGVSAPVTARHTTTTTGTATATATRARSRPRPQQSQAPSATAPARLPVSSASADVVQPQPPPGSCHARGAGVSALPDPRCTPGALSAAVTQANVTTTICRHGYTATVRPPESITAPEKEASLAAYGDTGSPHDYEYDHLVPLELGGAPNDPRNLWPQPSASPNPKDRLEDELTRLVCRGGVPLAFAQSLIAKDWVAARRWVHDRVPGFSWTLSGPRSDRRFSGSS